MTRWWSKTLRHRSLCFVPLQLTGLDIVLLTAAPVTRQYPFQYLIGKHNKISRPFQVIFRIVNNRTDFTMMDEASGESKNPALCFSTRYTYSCINCKYRNSRLSVFKASLKYCFRSFHLQVVYFCTYKQFTKPSNYPVSLLSNKRLHEMQKNTWLLWPGLYYKHK